MFGPSVIKSIIEYSRTCWTRNKVLIKRRKRGMYLLEAERTSSFFSRPANWLSWTIFLSPFFSLFSLLGNPLISIMHAGGIQLFLRCRRLFAQIQLTAVQDTRPIISQLWSFKIRRTTFLNYIKFADILLKLWKGWSGSSCHELNPPTRMRAF